MLESDKSEFKVLLETTFETYRVQAPGVNVLRLWWGVLSQYDICDVRAGFNAFCADQANKFPPVPAHIVDAIERRSPDGRLGADEAWALYPKNEMDSAVISDEMAEAMGVARGLLDDGDETGARMAFRDAYNRIVARNKARGIPVRWFPSFGTNPQGRFAAVDDAVKLGRLEKNHAAGLLPAPEGAQSLEQMLRITDKSAGRQAEINAKGRLLLQKASDKEFVQRLGTKLGIER